MTDDRPSRVRLKVRRLVDPMDQVYASMCKPTGEPLPDWMLDPKRLPKRPPVANDALPRGSNT